MIDGKCYIRPSESISIVGGLNVECLYMRTLLSGAYIDAKVMTTLRTVVVVSGS